MPFLHALFVHLLPIDFCVTIFPINFDCNLSCFVPPFLGWMDDSVFLRRNDMNEDPWVQHPSHGMGGGGDSYAHRAFTTGRRKPPPQLQQPPPPGHHPTAGRKVCIAFYHLIL